MNLLSLHLPLMLLCSSLLGDYSKEVYGPGGGRRHSADSILPDLTWKCSWALPLITNPACTAQVLMCLFILYTMLRARHEWI